MLALYSFAGRADDYGRTSGNPESEAHVPVVSQH